MRRELAIFVLVALIAAILALVEPRFLDPQSIESVLLWFPALAVVAMGQLLVVLTGGIDVSVGSILGFAGIAVGLLFGVWQDMPIAVGFVAGGAIGLLLGCINGALVAWCRLPALIVTVGTLATFRGLAFVLSKGEQVDSTTLPDELMSLSNSGVSASGITLTWVFILSLAIAVIVSAFLARTRTGRDLRACGSNREAAYLRGVSPSKSSFFAFAVCGSFAGIAGVMYASRFGFVNPASAGLNFELTVIAAVAIGGAKLSGGAGSVLGVLLGSALLSIVNVALSLLGIEADWQLLVYGVIILFAIAVDGGARRRWAH